MEGTGGMSEENNEIILRDLEGLKNDVEKLHQIRNELANKIKDVEIRILIKWNEIKDALERIRENSEKGVK